MTTPLLDRMAAYIRGKQCYCQGGKVRYSDEHQFCPRCEMLAEYDATRPQPGIPPEGDKGEFVLVPRPVVEFLNGAAPLEGCWFGSDRRPKFWWRRHLTSHAVAQCAPQREAVPDSRDWRLAISEAIAGFSPSSLTPTIWERIERRARELAGQGREPTE